MRYTYNNFENNSSSNNTKDNHNYCHAYYHAFNQAHYSSNNKIDDKIHNIHANHYSDNEYKFFNDTVDQKYHSNPATNNTSTGGVIGPYLST